MEVCLLSLHAWFMCGLLNFCECTINADASAMTCAAMASLHLTSSVDNLAC